MKKTSTLLAISMMSLLPLSALAADAPATSSSAKPATGELRGFDKYWSIIDPTGKGYITKDEWLAHAAEHFKEIDTDGDGKITKDEMKTYDQKMFEKRRTQFQNQQKKQ